MEQVLQSMMSSVEIILNHTYLIAQVLESEGQELPMRHTRYTKVEPCPVILI